MEFIQYERKDHIAVVTISREEALNALNMSLLTEMDGILDRMEADKDIYCVVITGEGNRSFVAGADINEMKDLDPVQAYNFGRFGNQVFRRIEKSRFPVIAAVNGYALGGGFELALACDIRLASENAVFGFPETGLGIIPGYGGTQRLPRIIGVSAAKKMLYTAEKIRADEAFLLGIVDGMVPLDDLMEEAFKLAGMIAKQAPIAVAKLKKSIDKGLYTDLDEALLVETELFSECFATKDQKNAMAAFAAKEKFGRFENQ